MVKKQACHLRHARGLVLVHAKPRSQPFDGNLGQIHLLRSVTHQLADQAVPQAAAGQLKCVDLQQVKERPQNGQAAANDRRAVFFQTSEAEFVSAAGRQQLFQQPVKPFAADRSRRPSGGNQHVAHSAYRAG